MLILLIASVVMAVQFIENRTYGEIQVGDSATLTRTLKPQDIQLFAIMSGDVNPAHVDPEYAHSSMFHEVIAHGMWGGALISTVLGTEFPGPGTIYIGQTLRFSRPVKVGDTIYVELYTPPQGEETVKYSAGRDLLVLVGKRTIRYNDILGQSFEVPIESQKPAAKPKQSE